MDTMEQAASVLARGKRFPVVQFAPSVRVSLGEEFGYPAGTALTKKIVGALRKAGFRRVVDTSTAADIVTVEEGTELLRRLESTGTDEKISGFWEKFRSLF